MTPSLSQSLWSFNRTRSGYEIAEIIQHTYRPSGKVSPFPFCSDDSVCRCYPAVWDYRHLQSSFLVKNRLYTMEFACRKFIGKYFPEKKAPIREWGKQNWAEEKVEL